LMSAFYEMSEMTSSEFRDIAKTIEIALVPVGATEQHGPHLALATDYVVAHRLAQAIARRLYPKAVVAPLLPFGFSHHHTGFAGTITIEPETFAAV
jgi:creatinine amidohydrolase